MAPSSPRVPTTDDERTLPDSATFDNKVKQHFGQVLSDTDGVTNHVKGFLERGIRFILAFFGGTERNAIDTP
uniref:Uncharacterized protein n=1 Tax=Romanomermis culicivorax TaxID=13658 RepID=A0A915HK99_ROMCU